MKRSRVRKKQQAADSNTVWGCEEIGKIVGKTAPQVRYLFSIGAFGDAVKKLSHKTFAGDRSKLQRFPNIASSD